MSESPYNPDSLLPEPEEGYNPDSLLPEPIVSAEEAAERDGADETARRIIATWTRGLITLSEMVMELQKVADVEHRRALQSGSEIAIRRAYLEAGSA